MTVNYKVELAKEDQAWLIAAVLASKQMDPGSPGSSKELNKQLHMYQNSVLFTDGCLIG